MVETINIDKLLVNEEFHKGIEYPWRRCYIALMRPSEREDMLKEPYVFSKENDGFIRKHWEQFCKLTLVDPFRLGKLVDLVIQTQHIPGDIVECGSYKGGSGILMGLLLEELGSDKKIHLFDSFDGLPEPDADHDKGYKRGQFKSNYDKLSVIIKELNLENRITLHKGWFSDTVPVFIANESPTISLFHVDCDLYNSTMDCFPSLYPLVSEGGAVVLDDFNDGGRGEKKAIAQVITEMNKKESIIVSSAPQSYFIKGQMCETDLVKEGHVDYSLTELLAHKDYLDWLQKNINEDYYSQLKLILENTSNMDNNNALSDISKIIEEVLELEDLNITETTKASDIEDWDSIVHIEIIVAIEKHFGVKFTTLEIEKFENVGDMVACVASK